jgi:hypothetical protein
MIDFLDIFKWNRGYNSGGAPSTDVRYWAERAAEILDEVRLCAGPEHEAREWLHGNSETFGEDTWEWDLRVYGIDLHQAQQAETPEAVPA